MLNRGVRGDPDVSALASLDRNQLCVLVWHYHDDDVPGPAAAVTLNIDGLPAAMSQVKLEHFRIDDEHSNAFTAWKRLGSPQHPTAAQYAPAGEGGPACRAGACQRPWPLPTARPAWRSACRAFRSRC